MDALREKSKRMRGMGALFDDMERKELFRKYFYFLCWVELGILITCWLYQIGESGNNRATVFPWRLYFLIAFLAPIAITFVAGTVVAGFNKYFAEPERDDADASEGVAVESDETGKIKSLSRMIGLLQKLPFLALLLVLGVGTAVFYKLGSLVSVLSGISAKSLKTLEFSFIVILLLASVLIVVLIVLNYWLRKAAMEYQYKAHVAEKLGLVILEDNTVLNSSGKLLANGAKFRKAPLQLLSDGAGENQEVESESCEVPSVGSMSRSADLNR